MEALSLVTRESFDEVMRLYTPTVYGIALSRLSNAADAEDVTQDVFVRYFSADITFESEEHRKAWLIRCAVNAVNSYARSAHFKRRTRTENIDELTDIAAADNVAQSAEDKELRGTVLAAVMQLPPKYRTAVHLFYFEDMSIAEISEVTGERPATVKTHLSRARDRLRKLLGEVL